MEVCSRVKKSQVEPWEGVVESRRVTNSNGRI